MQNINKAELLVIVVIEEGMHVYCLAYTAVSLRLWFMEGLFVILPIVKKYWLYLSTFMCTSSSVFFNMRSTSVRRL